MGLRASIQNKLKTNFNIPRWINYNHWRGLNQALVQTFKETFIWQTPVENASSFEEVVQQLKLSEVDLQIQQQWLWRLTKWCLSVFGLLVGYLIYLIMTDSWWSIIPTMILALMLLCQAFRYHFWYFQIAQRQLGCSLQTWYQVTFLGREVTHD